MTAGADEHTSEYFVVMRAQLGDRKAYATLFDRYNRRLIYYVRRLVGVPAEAEDVVQEVWLTVVRKLGKLERPAAFRTWLYRIAHSQAVSRFRAVKREVPIEDTPEALDIPDQTEADDLEFARTAAAVLNAALSRIPVVQREVLTLRFLEDLSYEEIAEVVGCTLGTVRSRIHYGKRALREQLAPSPNLEGSDQ